MMIVAILAMLVLGIVMILLALRDAWKPDDSDGVGDWIIPLTCGIALVLMAMLFAGGWGLFYLTTGAPA